MHAQVAVHRGAVKADVDGKSCAGPCWVLGAAVEADLRRIKSKGSSVIWLQVAPEAADTEMRTLFCLAWALRCLKISAVSSLEEGPSGIFADFSWSRSQETQLDLERVFHTSTT